MNPKSDNMPVPASGAAPDPDDAPPAGTPADSSGGDVRSRRSAGPRQRSDAAVSCKRERVQMVAGLQIVSTPIGNLGDLSPRAAAILGAVDIVACEDTRVTGKLLAAHGIDTRMVPYHDHSSSDARDRLIRRLKDGDSVALVSDAGTPLISDPGYKLVRAALDADIAVSCVPGPASPLAALVVSGLPTDRFMFAGYLPPKDKARRDFLTEIAPVRTTLIFLESTRRLAASLAALADVLGDRPAAVAREMTKLYEEVRRDTLPGLAAAYAAEAAPKGEAVIVVGPPLAAPPADPDTLLDAALATMTVRDAAAAVAAATGLPRKQVYARALARRAAAGDDDGNDAGRGS